METVPKPPRDATSSAKRRSEKNDDAERAEQLAREHTVHARERVLGYLLSTTAPAASSAR